MMKQTLLTVVARDATGGEPSITISTAALDRDRDELEPEGMIADEYLKNPIVQYGHDGHCLPVGATTRLDIVPGRGIRATFKWLIGDVFADRVKNAFDQGVLRAASVGFLPIASEPNAKGGRRYTSWRLLEWSLVNLPSNPEAVRILRGLGLPTSDEVVLELDDADVLDLDADDEVMIDVAPSVVAASIAAAIRDSIRETIQAETTRAIHRARGRVFDDVDPAADPAARRHSWGGSDLGIDRAAVDRILRGVIAEAIGDRRALAASIGAAVTDTLRQMRGKVD